MAAADIAQLMLQGFAEYGSSLYSHVTSLHGEAPDSNWQDKLMFIENMYCGSRKNFGLDKQPFVSEETLREKLPGQGDADFQRAARQTVASTNTAILLRYLAQTRDGKQRFEPLLRSLQSNFPAAFDARAVIRRADSSTLLDLVFRIHCRYLVEDLKDVGDRADSTHPALVAARVFFNREAQNTEEARTLLTDGASYGATVTAYEQVTADADRKLVKRMQKLQNWVFRHHNAAAAIQAIDQDVPVKALLRDLEQWAMSIREAMTSPEPFRERSVDADMDERYEGSTLETHDENEDGMQKEGEDEIDESQELEIVRLNKKVESYLDPDLPLSPLIANSQRPPPSSPPNFGKTGTNPSFSNNPHNANGSSSSSSMRTNRVASVGKQKEVRFSESANELGERRHSQGANNRNGSNENHDSDGSYGPNGSDDSDDGSDEFEENRRPVQNGSGSNVDRLALQNRARPFSSQQDRNSSRETPGSSSNTTTIVDTSNAQNRTTSPDESSEPQSEELNEMAKKARSKSHPDRSESLPPASAPKRRERWPAGDVRLLVKAIREKGCAWSVIAESKDYSFETHRTQQQIRDKARNLKVELLRSDLPLPLHFDRIALGPKERASVEKAGRNPDREEADVDPDSKRITNNRLLPAQI